MAGSDGEDAERDAPAWVRSVRSLGRVMAVIGALISAVIMLGISADVVWRQVTGRSIPGMLELVETFMVMVVFLGLAHAEAAGVHVRMTLVTRVLPDLAQRLARTLAMVLCLLGSLWFAWTTGNRAVDSFLSGEIRMGLLRFPVWPARIVIAVGFTVFALEYVVRIWEEWRGRRAVSDPTPAGEAGSVRRDDDGSAPSQEG